MDKSGIHGIYLNFKRFFVDEWCGWIESNKEEHDEFNEWFKFKCNVFRCCTKDKPFELDHITPLSIGRKLIKV